MKRFRFSLAGLVVIVGSAAIGAHHSYADFDLNRTVSVEGTIQEVLFANPHVVLTIKSNDSVVYRATWGAPRQLQRNGMRRDDLQPGDTVIVSGSPARDPSVRELSKLSEVRRPSDGWVWQMGPGPASVRRAALK